MGVLAELFLPFPWPLTARQDVYLFGMQGLTAMCVDFGTLPSLRTDLDSDSLPC